MTATVPHVPVTDRVPSPVVDRLRARIAASPGEAASIVDRFWSDLACSGGTPVIEPAEGDEAIITFVWRGTPGTTRVLFVPNRIGDRERRAESLLERLPGTDVWHIAYRLRTDHRASYQFAVSHDAVTDTSPEQLQEQLTALARHGEPDPLSTDTVPTRWGTGRSSVFALPDAPSRWWRASEPAAPGRVDSVQWAGTGSVAARAVHRYRAAHDGPQPLLLLCDGDMWFDRLDLPATLDAAIASGGLPPLTVLAPSAIDPTHRWADLTADDDFVDALVADLPDLADDLGAVRTDRTVLAGQSLGGLTALYAAARHPESFHGVIAQSPSTWWQPGADHTVPKLASVENPWLVEVFSSHVATLARADRPAIRIDVGAHEGAMPDTARRLADVLTAQQRPVRLTVYNGGHDYPCWQVALLDGLAALLGA